MGEEQFFIEKMVNVYQTNFLLNSLNTCSNFSLHEDIKNHIQYSIKDKNYETWYCIIIDGNYERLVGILCLLEEECKIIVRLLEIHPDYRRKGLGKRLLQISCFDRKIKKLVELWADITHVEIASFYFSCGFIPIYLGDKKITTALRQITKNIKQMSQIEWEFWVKENNIELCRTLIRLPF